MKLGAKKLSLIRALATKKGRRKYSSFLASGIRVIDEAVKAGMEIQYLVVARSELTAPGRDFVRSMAGFDIFEMPAKDLGQIDKFKSSQGIVAVISKPQAQKATEKLTSPEIVALDNISDPSNLGAIMRSALAFVFDDVLLGAGCAELYSPKVIQASAGAVFHLNSLTGQDLTEVLPELKSKGYSIIGTDTKGTDPEKALTVKDRLCLVIGNEARGISPEVTAWCDEIVRIPIAHRCESLSAPVAAGIVMYEISKRRPIGLNRRNIRRYKS